LLPHSTGQLEPLVRWHRIKTGDCFYSKQYKESVCASTANDHKLDEYLTESIKQEYGKFKVLCEWFDFSNPDEPVFCRKYIHIDDLVPEP
jgi:hypothetical protein